MQSGSGHPVPIAGIGASAGGLEALELLFEATPEDTGIAYVVVQHLSPDFDSKMVELLSRATTLRVVRAEDGQRLEPNTVYVMPPRKEMIVSGGALLLTEKDSSNGDLRLPIDVFLRSLAQDAGPYAMAVILSGTGSDGSRGVLEVNESGGLVLCQDPASAKFDGMPRSAIDTAVVDLVIPPERMPDAMVNYTAHLRRADDNAVGPPAPRAQGIGRILGLLRQDCGIDFNLYKKSTVTRRIERRILLQQADDLDSYTRRLEEDPDERNALYRDLLIGVTKFFRDRDAFQKLEREVIPDLIGRLPPQQELRVWVAACGTGEEAYSLAILIHEACRNLNHHVSAKIFATDVHKAALEHAAAGIYAAASLEGVSSNRRERYFINKGNAYQVHNDLRQMLVFAPHNVIADAPFTRMDLITCRNMLIYLEPAAQRKVLSLFLFGLKRGGVLFLGKSENATSFADELETLGERERIYRKRRDIKLPHDMRTPFARSGGDQMTTSLIAPRPTAGGLLRIYDALLDEHMPPSVLIDDQRNLLHSFGGAGQYMRVRDGRPTVDILDLIRPELRTAVTGALQHVRKTGKPISLTRIPLGSDGDQVQIRARRVGRGDDANNNVLISFEPMEPGIAAPPDQAIDVSELSEGRIADLERELQHSRESLQATIEELETSNEELQASNEELVASNEELQSTNEELQSVNEELYTVNAEFQKKIQQLTELTNDMNHLLSSMEVGTLFLDQDLKIRKFTPMAEDLFRLQGHDIGRPLSDFRFAIDHDDLISDAEKVLGSRVRIDREVRDSAGNWFLLRTRPYLVDDDCLGIVLTLIDVASLKEAEERVRKAVVRRDEFLAMLSHELRNPLAAIVNAVQLAHTHDETLSKRALDIIEGQSAQMARLLDDLLDISRVTRNKMQLKREIIDLRPCIEEAIESVRMRTSRLEVTIESELPGAPLFVNGDPARLQQVVANLVSNAIKYNSDRGHVWLRAYREGGDIVLRVRDDGIGMSEDLLESAFEPFVQSDRGLSRSDGGMGVGLTLVRSIVEMHGGQVRAHSEGAGEGSEFVIRLPAVMGYRDETDGPRAKADGDGQPAGPVGALDILLIEDNADSRLMLQALLERHGHKVEVAADGADALEMFENGSYDVALIDIGLPSMDGYQLARQIRKEGNGIRLVALTGYGRPDDREAALEAGFDEHLVKPISLDELQAVIARLK